MVVERDLVMRLLLNTDGWLWLRDMEGKRARYRLTWRNPTGSSQLRRWSQKSWSWKRLVAAVLVVMLVVSVMLVVVVPLLLPALGFEKLRPSEVAV